MTGQEGAGAVLVTWLDEDDVAALTRTPVNTVRGWRRRRIGPAFCRTGRRVLYARQDVDAFIATGRVETSATVLAPGPERAPARAPRGSGAVTPVRQTASEGFPGVSVPGGVSPDLSDGREDVA
jgi:hypothetical protein